MVNNKTEECLCVMPEPNFTRHRYIDCAGETAWLNDCAPELEIGPVYFARYERQITILQWNTDQKFLNELM